MGGGGGLLLVVVVVGGGDGTLPARGRVRGRVRSQIGAEVDGTEQVHSNHNANDGGGGTVVTLP